ncbi:hypothetical protein EPI10_010627 [Gossypium australe]|uniref:Uncharacterized protein n=1 Tax=Gossypium australe TaxID=47621 RepID=A0A5B6W6E7_9ROSI|nr:hypothetical protein EPI10_010627 [Gossypium australe]
MKKRELFSWKTTYNSHTHRTPLTLITYIALGLQLPLKNCTNKQKLKKMKKRVRHWRRKKNARQAKEDPNFIPRNPRNRPEKRVKGE